MDCARAWVLYFCLSASVEEARRPQLLGSSSPVIESSQRADPRYIIVSAAGAADSQCAPHACCSVGLQDGETHVDFSDIEKECERPKSLGRKQFEARRRKVKLKQRIAKEAKKRDLRSGEKVGGAPRGVSAPAGNGSFWRGCGEVLTLIHVHTLFIQVFILTFICKRSSRLKYLTHHKKSEVRSRRSP